MPWKSGLYPSLQTEEQILVSTIFDCARLDSAFLPKLGPFFACSFCAERSQMGRKDSVGNIRKEVESFPLVGKDVELHEEIKRSESAGGG